MKERVVIFTHIQKTAGTSVMKELFYQNYNRDEIRRFWGGFGIKKLVFSNTLNYKIFTGHFPYGIHDFIRQDCQYMTFLREPIARAVSHYNFIKNNAGESNNENKYKKLHQETELKDFFKRKSTLNPFKGLLVDNMQTRMLAGYRYYSFSPSSERLLSQAKRNLEKKYRGFGIQEEYELSMEKIAKIFEWEYSPKGITEKRTQRKEDVDEITMDILNKYHKLDIELYEFSKELFKSL